MEVLGNAITFAIQGQTASPDREMTPGMLAEGGDRATLEGSLNTASTSRTASDGTPL